MKYNYYVIYEEHQKPMINFFKEKIEFDSVDSIIKLHMLIKSYQLGYHLSEADINTLFELHKTGYGSDFYKNCVEKKYFKTKQTVRNSIGKMTNMGILTYKKRGERSINEEFCPKIDGEQLIFISLVGNINSW